jgi:hypothetical protein
MVILTVIDLNASQLEKILDSKVSLLILSGRPNEQFYLQIEGLRAAAFQPVEQLFCHSGLFGSLDTFRLPPQPALLLQPTYVSRTANSVHTGYFMGPWVYVRPLGVVHWCQPGRGCETLHPLDCLTLWQRRLLAPALHAQVRPPWS